MLLPDSDFIVFSYSGRPFYWSSETRRALEDSSRLLSDLVTRTRWLFPNAELDIVGYSVGGLVVLYWAQHLAAPEDLAALNGVLLIGTPINGVHESWVRSTYQRICVCPILGDIHIGSPTLQAWDLPMGIPKLVVVNSANDWLVNGKLGDGTSLGLNANCARLEMAAVGEPVHSF